MNDARMLAARFLSVAIVWAGIGLVGCSSPPPKQPDARRYDLRGKVVSVSKETKKVMVDHEAIPGFMAAMTMVYRVKDQHLLDNLSPGDRITAKVVSSGSEIWLDDIAVVNPGASAK